MVKGVSKQVILVKPREEALFEQAIFIVKDGAKEVTDRQLLQQAREAAEEEDIVRNRFLPMAAAFLGGSGTVGLIWLICSVI